MKEGHIFFILGVSGAGKGTLIENLKKQKELDLSFVKSYVTREIRKGEIPGNIYHFISKEEFKKSIKLGEFMEYFKVFGLPNYYGTKYRDIVDNGINLGKIVVKEIDMNGLKIIKSKYPELRENFSSIFLDLPLEEQLKRIKARGVYMGEEEWLKRKKTAKEECVESRINCDYIVDVSNNTKKETLDDVLNIIKKVIKNI